MDYKAADFRLVSEPCFELNMDGIKNYPDKFCVTSFDKWVLKHARSAPPLIHIA